jgi:DNA-binding CsgD family transcriptional regulator
VKGKPWSKEDEKTLVQMIGKGKTVGVIAKALGKTESSVYIKMRRRARSLMSSA